MENFKKIADVIVISPKDKEKVKRILEQIDICILDEGMRYSIIEKVEG